MAAGKREAWILMEIDGQGILVVSNPIEDKRFSVSLWIWFGPRAPVCSLCLWAEARGWEHTLCLGNSWDSLCPVSPWPGLARDTQGRELRQPWGQPGLDGRGGTVPPAQVIIPTSTPPVSWRLPGP